MKRESLHPLYYDLCNTDNVVGLGRGNKWVRGKDTRQEAIVVLVRKKVDKDQLNRKAVIPDKLDGMFTDVIEVGDIGFHSTRKQLLRPAFPGVSIGHYKVSAGTFGAVVRDRDSGEALILSNNHVLANLTDGRDGRSAPGDAVLQPGVYDQADGVKNQIGVLKKFVPIYHELNPSQCAIANLFEKILNKLISAFRPQYSVRVLRNNSRINLVDCAVATPDSEDSIRSSVLEIGEVAGCKAAVPGMIVKKSGRSSGVTRSIILATEVSMKINVSEQQSAIFADQILAGPMSIPGDSGSLVLTEDNYAIGLLFAGSEQATMFNRIDHVLDALDVQLALD